MSDQGYDTYRFLAHTDMVFCTVRGTGDGQRIGLPVRKRAARMWLPLVLLFVCDLSSHIDEAYAKGFRSSYCSLPNLLPKGAVIGSRQ